VRCALTIAYNGTHFLGSQVQKETSNTIFGQLEKALFQLGIDFRVVASGRTDKGVHATGQVCHIDLPSFWDDIIKLKKVLNEMLPPSIRIIKAEQVDSDFHARYSAKKRVYRYLIKNENINPFENDFVSFIPNINFQKIQKNIKFFIGEHDFKQFMKTGSDISSTRRIVYKSFAYQHKNYIVLHFEANGYLRSQIRLMVGALLQLGSKEILEQLASTAKYKIKPAPSNGLYLSRIKY